MTAKAKRLCVFFCLIVLLLTSCSTEVERQSDKPLVYASFYPIYDLVESVGKDTIELRSFMPQDKDPHLWEPSPKDIRRLSEADLLVVNGANMEKWLDSVRDTLPDLEVLVLSDAVELITYKGAAAIGDFQYMCEADLDTKKYSIEFGHTHEDIMRIAFFKDDGTYSQKDLIDKGKKIMEKKAKLVPQGDTISVEEDIVYGIEMGHESGMVYYELPEDGKWIFICDRVSEPILSYELLNHDGELLEKEVLLEGSTSGFDKITYDPHSWLSLVNAKKYLNRIQDVLTEMMPQYKNTFRKNKLKVVDEITTLEYEFRDKFKDVRIREFVTIHNAYSYLARDFDIKMFPLQGLTSMESPSLKTIRKALDFCNYYDINTIFYEYGQSAKGADTLAYELGGKTVPLASMEYVTREQKEKGEHYADLMRMNIENIYESLR
ncbi:MAG: zinc ABC transporter substrate-binding protein [Tissierellia bacterium]|nr:zinc ABC transporter substrate-binding protein [Tissierellia bacterium]